MPNFNLPEGMIFADQFRILRLFASGAFGDVYAASDTKSNVNVAIKVVDFSQHPALEERFRREAAILATIQHPNIMRLVSTGDAVDKDGRPVWYMATELISGRTVWNRVQKDGPFGVDEAVDLVGQACDALQHVHDELSETILHRDLKPDNLMLERGNHVRLVDFGIAKELEIGHEMSTIQAGHPSYAAPEQVLKGQRALSRASDIYSLAKTLSTMITGEIPDQGQVASLLPEVMQQPHAAEVLEVLKRATDEDPAKRPQRAAEFKRLLFEAVGRTGEVSRLRVATPPPTPAERATVDEMQIPTQPEPVEERTAKTEKVESQSIPPTPSPQPEKTSKPPTVRQPLPTSEEPAMNTLKTVIVTLLVVVVVGLGAIIYFNRDKLFGPQPPAVASADSARAKPQGQPTTTLPVDNPLVEILSPATVDGQGYGEQIDWENGDVKVVGMGTASVGSAPSEAGMRMAAMLTAKRDGYTRLAAALGRMRVTEDSRGGVELGQYVAATYIQQVVQGARFGRAWTQKMSDGSVLAFQEMILPRSQWPKPQIPASKAKPAAQASSLPGAKKGPGEQQGPFTGIIIDATGMGLRPGASPAILVEGQETAVYQFTDASTEVYEQKGLVGYARTVDAAKRIRDRAGANPIVLPAASVVGTTAYVTPEVAAKILAADVAGANLKRMCKVIFVTG